MAESPEDLRQTADEVLSQPKFVANEPSLLDRAWDRVTEFLGDLLSVVSNATAFGGVAVGWIILAAMLGLIVFFLVRVMPRRRMTRSAGVHAEVKTRATRTSRATWLAEAEAAEAAGLHREAVRARYRATVAGLVENEELPDVPGATVGELATAFEADPSRSDPFTSSGGAFSDVWYGGDDAEKDDADRIANWDQQILTERKR